jgi:PA domain/PDZ domain
MGRAKESSKLLRPRWRWPALCCILISTLTLSVTGEAKLFSVRFDTARPIGLKLSPELVVTGFARDPKDNSKLPAEKSAWLRNGDKLVEVNGQKVVGVSLSEVQQLISRASLPKELVFEPVNGNDRAQELADHHSSEEGMHGHPVRLQLFKRGSLLKTSSNGNIAIPHNIHGLQAMFGGPIGCTPVTGAQFVVSKPLHGCLSHQSREGSVAGKILLAFRGECSFSDKAVLAQDSGAAALLVINDDKDDPEETIRMPWNPESSFKEKDLSLPVAMVSYKDGLNLLKYLANGTSQAFGVSAEANGARGRRDRDTPQTMKIGSEGQFLSKLAGFSGPSEIKGRVVLTEHGHLCPTSLSASAHEGGKFSTRLLASEMSKAGEKTSGSSKTADAGSGSKDDLPSVGNPSSPSGIVLLFPSQPVARVPAGSNESTQTSNDGSAPAEPARKLKESGYYKDDAEKKTEGERTRDEQGPSWLRRLTERYKSRLPPSWFRAEEKKNSTETSVGADGETASENKPSSLWSSLYSGGVAVLAAAAVHRGEYLLGQAASSASGGGSLSMPPQPLRVAVPGDKDGGICKPSSGPDPSALLYGCSPYRLSTSSSSGPSSGPVAALVLRGGGCTFADKARLAKEAGAAALVVGNEDLTQPLVSMQLSVVGSSSNDAASAGVGALPAVMVPRSSYDELAEAACDGNEGYEVAFIGDDGGIAKAWTALSELRWPADKRQRRKLYLSLSRDNHPDREGGDPLRFDYLVQSYERAAAAEDHEGGAASGEASTAAGEPSAKDEL